MCQEKASVRHLDLLVGGRAAHFKARRLIAAAAVAGRQARGGGAALPLAERLKPQLKLEKRQGNAARRLLPRAPP